VGELVGKRPPGKPKGDGRTISRLVSRKQVVRNVGEQKWRRIVANVRL
jgi:hypothetical protein